MSPPHVPLGPAVCVRGVSCAVGSAPMDRAGGLGRGRFRFRFLGVGTRLPDTGGRPVFFVVQGVARLCGSDGLLYMRAGVCEHVCVCVGGEKQTQ